MCVVWCGAKEEEQAAAKTKTISSLEGDEMRKIC